MKILGTILLSSLSLSDAVSFDQSMYVTTESSVVVMVIGGNLMEEVALSIELENSDYMTGD